MSARILITGATGTVGSLLARRLAQASGQSSTVVAGVHTEARRERLEKLGIETVSLDYTDAVKTRTALAGVTRLFLVTGYSVDMLMHSKAVLDAARCANVEHVVHLGAAGSSDQPYSHLAWHDYVEKYIQALEFGYTHLQPRTYMNNVLRGLRKGSTVIRQFFGGSAVTWIDADDIAAVAEAALLKPEAHQSQTYTLAAESLTLFEVAETLTRATGLEFSYEPLDPERAVELLTKAGMEPIYGASLARSIADVARGISTMVSEANDTVEQVTGRPRTRWIDFAQRHRDMIIRAVAKPG